MKSITMLQDCMEYMKTVPDKWFDLACVDPPYGLGKSVVNSGGRFKRYKNKNGNWDLNKPDDFYFNELFRISKNQIIFGGNYFSLPANKSFIILDKGQPEGISFAMCEYAWCSFDSVAQILRMRTQGMAGRDHPTAKPIKLYSWIYANYLPQGGRVFDSHLGSGSNRIAADKAGNIDFYATEIDADYFEAQEKRWRQYKSAPVMVFPERIEPVQINLLL